MTTDYVRVFKGKDDQWYWETRARNEKTLATSEGYTRGRDAVRGATDANPGMRIVIDDALPIEAAIDEAAGDAE